MPPPEAAAKPNDASSQWMDKMSKKFAAKPAKLSEATIDATFNAFWKKLGNKPEKIQEALKRTRDQIGGPMPGNYVPPPLRNPSPAAANPGRPGPYVEDLETGECVETPAGNSTEPDGEQVCRADETSAAEGESCEDPNAGSDGAQGEDPGVPLEANVEKSFKDLPGGLTLTFKIGSKGGQVELAKKKDDPNSLTYPVYPGVYIDVAIKLKAGIAGKVDLAEWKVEGGISADVDITLRGGIPKVASIGGGFRYTPSLKAKLSGTYKLKPFDVELTDGGIFAELKGAVIVNATLDKLGLKLEFKGGEMNLLQVIWSKTGGWDVGPGPDVKALINALDALSSDPDSHAGWSSCAANDGGEGSSGVECEDKGGQGGQGGYHG